MTISWMRTVQVGEEVAGESDIVLVALHPDEVLLRGKVQDDLFAAEGVGSREVALVPQPIEPLAEMFFAGLGMHGAPWRTTALS